MLYLISLPILALALSSTLEINNDLNESVKGSCQELIKILRSVEGEIASSNTYKAFYDSDLVTEHINSELNGYYNEFNSLCGRTSHLKNADELQQVIKRVNSAFFVKPADSSESMDNMSSSSTEEDSPRLRHSPSYGPSYISGHIHQKSSFVDFEESDAE